MIKTISAALLAVSVIAAPAFAAGQNKAAQAPVSKRKRSGHLIQVDPEKSWGCQV